jgi:hypothetical protein
MVNPVEGRIRMVNMIHLAAPAGSHTSQPDPPRVTKFPIRPDIFI